LEFAQMYRRFGSRGTVVERAEKLLPREDDGIAAEIRSILAREGIAIATGAECMALKRHGGRSGLGLECIAAGPIAEGSQVLVDAESKELLGVSLLGMSADEVVHSLLDVMYARKPYTTIQRAVHIHPTVSELVPTLLAGLKPLS